MFDYIDARIDALTGRCTEVLEKQGFKRLSVRCQLHIFDCEEVFELQD